MPKLLILSACAIAGETIARHVAVGEQTEVAKDDARYLVDAGRALYLDKADDHNKGLSTATAADVKRAKEQAEAIAAQAEASRRANQPPDLAALLANAVAQGMAMAAQQAAAKPA